MKRDVVEVFARCDRCGGKVLMSVNQHRQWQTSGEPAICLDCQLMPPEVAPQKKIRPSKVTKKRHRKS